MSLVYAFVDRVLSLGVRMLCSRTHFERKVLGD